MYINIIQYLKICKFCSIWFFTLRDIAPFLKQQKAFYHMLGNFAGKWEPKHEIEKNFQIFSLNNFHPL